MPLAVDSLASDYALNIEINAVDTNIGNDFIRDDSGSANINEEIKMEPLIKVLMDVFDGELLNR